MKTFKMTAAKIYHSSYPNWMAMEERTATLKMTPKPSLTRSYATLRPHDRKVFLMVNNKFYVIQCSSMCVTQKSVSIRTQIKSTMSPVRPV